MLVKKGEQLLSFFTTGCGVQQRPLKDFKGFRTIREQVRAQMQTTIVAVRTASVEEAEVPDLADDLELDAVGIAPPTLKAGRL